jgi:The ARF-like 2 binding protein BART
MHSKKTTFTPTDQIDVEIFDLLMSLGDFDEFKNTMLAYKQQKENIVKGVPAEPLTIFGINVGKA